MQRCLAYILANMITQWTDLTTFLHNILVENLILVQAEATNKTMNP